MIPLPALLAFGLSTLGAAAATYYIDAANGSDSNPGSEAQPWRTYGNIVTYYTSAQRPPGWVALQPGDTVFFGEGLYDFSYDYNSPGPNPTPNKAFFVRNVHGSAAQPITLKAYPGTTPVFDPPAQLTALEILQSDHWVIDGLEIRDSWGRGIHFEEGDGHLVTNCHIHGTDGLDNNNVAGLGTKTVHNLEVSYCRFEDNYDHTNADNPEHFRTDNSRHMVFFLGGDIHVHHCYFANTPDRSAHITGNGIGFKHAAPLPNSTFEVDHCIFVRCANYSLSSGTANTHFHHNLAIDGGGVLFTDLGGPTDIRNMRVDHNTFVNSGYTSNGSGLSFVPETEEDGLGPIAFTRNIVLNWDLAPQSSQRGMIDIGRSLRPDLFVPVTAPDNLAFEHNCYHDPLGPPVFNLFNSSRVGPPPGDSYDFAGWQDLGYDTSSQVADPQLDSSSVPLNPTCQDRGRFGDASPFEIWQYRHFSFPDLTRPAVSGPSADPDQDGRDNAREAEEGTNPLQPDGPPPTLNIRPAAELNWQSQPGLLYQIQCSPDLQFWTNFGDPIPGDGTEISHLVAITAERKFFRLR